MTKQTITLQLYNNVTLLQYDQKKLYEEQLLTN